MKFLEDYDLEHLKPKFVGKIMNEILLDYIHLQEPDFKSEYLGKITSSDFKKLSNAFYDNLDLFGLGKLENVSFIDPLTHRRVKKSLEKPSTPSSLKKNQKSRKSPQQESSSLVRNL